MDSKLFRLPTSPNFIRQQQPVDARTIAVNQSIPAPDSRFPGWPAPMADARLVTNYQPHCESNIPADKQYPTTRWMQRNGEQIIEMNRKIASKQMGAIYPLDSTVVPPPTDIFSCTRSECSRKATGQPGGIGTERIEPVPELFGTYTVQQVLPVEPYVQYTSVYEGGRNSLRGKLVLEL